MKTNNIQNWQLEHYKIIVKFMDFLGKHNKNNGFILKGGTALMLCYGLNRFSEDIDLDGFTGGIEEIIHEFTKEVDMQYRIAKNTDAVKRFMIKYDNKYLTENEEKPLKIEVSYRDYHRGIKRESMVCGVNNVKSGALVYTIDSITELKLQAFMGRDTFRDMHDIVYLGLNYYNKMSNYTKENLKRALQTRGLGHFDYIMGAQSDSIIDPTDLEYNILKLWHDLGIND